jgi:VWFA-related protein
VNPFLRAILAAAAICLWAAPAQFRSDVRLVVIHATVTDKRGNFVTGLPASAFHVFENGREQSLKQAVQEDIPVTLGILTDDSGSMRRLYPLVIEAIRKMSDDLNPDDEVFLAHFSMYFNIDVPPATSPAALRKALAGLTPRDGTTRYQTGTDLFDCLRQSLIYMEKTTHRDKTALLVVTDGSDTASLLSLKQIVEDIGHRRSLIYAIGLPGKEIRRGKAALRQITEASGGQAFFPGAESQLPRIALQIAREMRSQYTLTYTPESQDLDGSYRGIAVKVNNPRKSPDPVVRARPGYFASARQ